MSWQDYVDKSLVGTGHLDKASIISAAGDSVWATTPSFQISPSELSVIVQGLKGGAAADKFWAEGIHIGEEKYVATKVEGRSIYGRKVREGIVICKTTQAIIIAHYGENATAGNAATTVEKLADYLVGQGY